MTEIKELLSRIADYFYQGKNDEGMSLLMESVGEIGGAPGAGQFINPLFDALDGADYILAADILQHEIAENI